MAKAFKVSGKLELDSRTFAARLSDVGKTLGKEARGWQRSLHGVSMKLGTLRREYGSLGSVLGSLGVGISIKSAIMMADSYQALDQRVRRATAATRDYAQVSQELFSIAQATGVKLADVELTFRMLSMSAKDLGASNTQILAVVKSVNQLGALSGADSERLTGGIRQFAQMMSKGKVQAEELNILMENLPELGFAITQSLGMSVGKMRELMEKGKLTSQMVFDAMLKKSRQINAEFAKGYRPTLGQQGNKAANEFSKALAEIDPGAVKMIGEGLQMAARNAKPLLYLAGVLSIGMGFKVARLAMGSFLESLSKGSERIKQITGWMNKFATARKAAAAAKALVSSQEAELLRRYEAYMGNAGSAYGGMASGRAAQAADELMMFRNAQRAAALARSAAWRGQFGGGVLGGAGSRIAGGINALGFTEFGNFLAQTPWKAVTSGVGRFITTTGLLVGTATTAYQLTRKLMNQLNADKPVQNAMMALMDQGGDFRGLGERSKQVLESAASGGKGMDTARLERLQEENNRLMKQMADAQKELANLSKTKPGKNSFEGWAVAF